MNVRKTGVLFVLLVILAAASANATTINFASLQGSPPDPELSGALMPETSYTQQGFVVASIGGRFDVWKLGNSNFPGTSPGATSLFEFSAGAETSITHGGQPFTLNSIDFAPLLRGGSGPFIFFVTGVFPDESFITQKVTINNSPFGLQRVTFSGFTNVVAVNFIQGTSAGYFQGQETAYQFNNIVVNNRRYVNGVNGNDSNDCLSVQNACKTIGHAISLASSDDSIIVAAGTYFEGLSIGQNLKILGSGCSKTIINGSSGSGVAHVVSISSAAVVTLSGLSINGGSGSTAGGGIYNAGTLILNNSCVDGNHVQGSGTAGLAAGGGIYNASVLTINNSELSGNTAVASPATGASGGGIYNQGRLTINRSTINGNSASGSGSGGEYGGGISNYGTLTINNTTLLGNSAIGSGGGIYNRGTLIISNATISGNNAYGGGGIYNYTGHATLQNSIVANSSGGNCSGTIVSSGYNLSSDGTCNFNGPGDMNNTIPMLGTLGNNGGPTPTIPLLPGSLAIDAGNPSGCKDGQGHLLTTDQRGMPRPDSADKTKTGCDMGAFEKQND